jgi:uncharacterized membrane protein YhaH (DUF805 family)
MLEGLTVVCRFPRLRDRGRCSGWTVLFALAGVIVEVNMIVDVDCIMLVTIVVAMKLSISLHLMC